MAGQLLFQYPIAIDTTSHIRFQLCTNFSGNIISLTNSTTGDLIKVSCIDNGTNLAFTYTKSKVLQTTYTHSPAPFLATTYKYFHLIILPTTAYLYGENGTTVTLITAFAPAPISALQTNYDGVYLSNTSNAVGDMKVSYFTTTNHTQTAGEITSTLPFNFKPIWTLDTLSLARFDSTLGAGAIQILSSWRVYRRKENDTAYTFVGETLASQKNIVDMAVPTNTNLHYQILPTSPTQTGTSIEMTPDTYVKIDSWNYSLTSTISKQVVLFSLDIENSETIVNEDRFLYLGFDRHGKVALGKRQYESGSLSATFGMIDNSGNYIDTADNFKALEDFFALGGSYLYKTRKGEIKLVSVYGLKKKIDDKSIEQVTKVSFSWDEIDDANGFVLYDYIAVWDDSKYWQDL